ncbi:hypothetical protein M885DRAFT_624007 [Pelagophyceae sp. CCMP2097]|nr:hypothetical protein M885DRAFT_624007 [Pelagophyceae sp. CCMP2097]
MSTFSDADGDADERAMEVEALEAIFSDDFKLIDAGEDALRCSISLAPDDDVKHVGATLAASAPFGYPSQAAARFDVVKVKGLAKSHKEELEALAAAAAADLEGVVCIFEVATAVRDWLGEHNTAGLGDDSMYAAMVRRDEAQKVKPKAEPKKFGIEGDEAKKIRLQEEAEAARLERLRLGTAVTAETFERWRVAFHAELAAKKSAATGEATSLVKKITGKQFFESGGVAIEADEDDGADDAGASGPVDATLFEDDDDDLDFDSDDEDDDDDEDEDDAA